MSNYIHPMFPKLREKATKYLTINGYELIKDEDGKRTFINKSNIYISVVNQRYDPPEIWIGKRHDKEMIRIDFILEYYLTGKTELISSHIKSETLNDDQNCFKYYSEFLESFLESTVNINPFPSTYYDWQKENQETIRDVSKELRKQRTDNNA